MKTSEFLNAFLLTASALFASNPMFSQGLADSLAQDERNIVSSIAPYAAEMRAAILDVSQYPEAIVKLERTQARSSQSFQDLISNYSREEQEKYYQIARFPELTSQLAGLGRKDPEEIKPYLKDYPDKAQQQILDLYRDHYDDLLKMNSIYEASQKTMERITSGYPVPVREHFKKVISSPDVMNLLTDNIDLTVSLGEAYKANPSGITRELDDLSKRLSEQNAKDLDEYKGAVERDPKLQAEMKKAADEFSHQYDQDDTNPAYVANNYYDNYPYPYWYGYPYWYSNPMWYPTPFYYQTGFYYGPGGAMVIAGLPSLFYANWFFRSGYSRYPGLYNHYNAYYNVHRADIINRNVYRGFNTTVHNQFSGVNRGINRVSTGHIPSPGRASIHMSQMNVRPGNFNNSGFSHYNSTSFHSGGWSHVGGGRRGR